MDKVKVRLAKGGEAAKVIDTVVLAFAADPFVRWFFPGAQQYLANMRDFAGAFGETRFVMTVFSAQRMWPERHCGFGRGFIRMNLR